MDNGACVNCGAGTYQPVTGANSSEQCLPCQTCHADATTPGTCGNGSSVDMSCTCKATFYGTGLECAACRACDANATVTTECDIGSTEDVKACECNSGYHGGGFSCAACRVCHASYGSQTSDCTSTANRECQCNENYYGDGVTCTACKTCNTNAAKTGSCDAGSTEDGVRCACNAGYHGDGVNCVACAAGKYSATSGATGEDTCISCEEEDTCM